MLITRKLKITIDNKTIGDNFWLPSTIATLKEYIRKLETGELGNEATEIFHDETNNNILIAYADLLINDVSIYDEVMPPYYC